MADGIKKDIKDVKEGDMVLSFDIDSGQHVAKKVLYNDSRHTVESHAEACLSMGDPPSLYTINDGLIEFTPEHPFLVREKVKNENWSLFGFLKSILNK